MDTAKFPLWALLALYENANSADLFPNYMEGMQELIHYLSPIDIPEFPIIPIPKLHRNWELNNIAELLHVHPSIVYQEYNLLLRSRHSPYKQENSNGYKT